MLHDVSFAVPQAPDGDCRLMACLPRCQAQSAHMLCLAGSKSFSLFTTPLLTPMELLQGPEIAQKNVRVNQVFQKDALSSSNNHLLQVSLPHVEWPKTCAIERVVFISLPYVVLPSYELPHNIPSKGLGVLREALPLKENLFLQPKSEYHLPFWPQIRLKALPVGLNPTLDGICDVVVEKVCRCLHFNAFKVSVT